MNNTLSNGLRMIEAMATGDGPRGVTELARETGLNKSNVHRLLQTLCASSFVRRRAGGGRYELTLKLWELGNAVRERRDVVETARPHMQALAGATGETVHVAVLDGAEILYVGKVDGTRPLIAYSRVGGRAPAHCVATGKVLLADLPDDDRRKRLTGLRAFTARTVTDADELLAVLAEVRRRGVAFNYGEWHQGVRGLGAPILDGDGGVIAALGISGPAERLKRAVMGGLAGPLVDAARAISVDLGSRVITGEQQ